MIRKILFFARLMRLQLHFVFVATIFFSISITVHAQNDLQFFLESAFKNNPLLKENVNLIKSSEIDKKIAEAEYSLPKIFLTSNYLFTPYFNNGGKLISSDPDPEAIGYDAGITNGGLYSAMINIEKNIFTGGIVDAYNQQSEVKIKSGKNAIEVLKHSITKDVTDQYLSTYQAQRMFELSKSIADTIKKQLLITEDLVKKGFAKQSDYLLLKIEVDNQIISAEQSLSSFKTSLSELNTLCGLNSSKDLRLATVELNYEGMKTGSNYFKQFEYDSLMITSQQKVLETKYLPQVNLFFNTGLNAVELDGIQRKFGMSAGINFSLPIYDGEQKNLSQQRTQISLKTVNAYRENQIVSVSNKKRDAKEQIEFFTKNLNNISSQIRSYEQVLKLAQAELLNGHRSTIDYITMIRSFLELKKNELTAEVGYQLAINQYNYWNW